MDRGTTVIMNPAVKMQMEWRIEATLMLITPKKFKLGYLDLTRKIWVWLRDCEPNIASWTVKDFRTYQ